ncbi:helix-turn-helix transcriptional regulator [Candidatus Poribacteria bacterium]|nr:helix-turn-helix transcriptional regulator [Candidatus Poribacteria bacterium]
MATNHILLKKFGDRVRSLRNQAGISQEKLAEMAEMHRTYISGIERGERNVSLINIMRLASALNVSVSKLMEGID